MGSERDKEFVYGAFNTLGLDTKYVQKWTIDFKILLQNYQYEKFSWQ